MKKVQKRASWKQQGWRSCQDLHIKEVASGSPRYLRCMRCYRLVTHGQISKGGCSCGFRKLNPCLELTLVEMALLKFGWFPLRAFERDCIKPLCPRLGLKLRTLLFRLA